MSFKIQYASDLHLEFRDNEEFVASNPIEPVGDVLVLCGDIVPLKIMDKHADFFDYLSDHFQTTYWVPGNHEYYEFDLFKKEGQLQESIRHNVFLVNNTSVVHENVKLIFSTLWSKISPVNQWQIEQGMYDFRKIKYDGLRFSAARYNHLHEQSLNFIKNEIEQSQHNVISVFTHHCPTFLNYPEQYKGDVLNEAFATELFDFIESSQIYSWVYGHHHTNTAEFMIGNTKLLTNQLGYVYYNEHFSFQRNKIIGT